MQVVAYIATGATSFVFEVGARHPCEVFGALYWALILGIFLCGPTIDLVTWRFDGAKPGDQLHDMAELVGRESGVLAQSVPHVS